jgi:2-oxoglutarate ferredoxin oxidoreductase subunit beta
MDQLIQKGLEHKGFGVVEILSQCPTHFGRYALRSGSPQKNLDWIRELCVPKANAESMMPEELEGKMVTGVFSCSSRPVFRGSTFIEEKTPGE